MAQERDSFKGGKARAFRKSCQPPTVDCEFCERLVVKHTTDDLPWLWAQFSVLEEGAAKARLAGRGEGWGGEAEVWLMKRLPAREGPGQLGGC